jgi:hypothetical protein
MFLAGSRVVKSARHQEAMVEEMVEEAEGGGAGTERKAMPSYNERRERSYETSVRNDAYRARVSIEVEDGAAFIVVEGARELLCRPAMTRSFWYETWLAFNKRYSGTPGFGAFRA